MSQPPNGYALRSISACNPRYVVNVADEYCAPPNHLPATLTSPSMAGLEPNIYRYFLVLHDGSDGDETQADAILATMKARFGDGNCAKLIVNTFVGEKDANDGRADLWKNHVPPTKADAAVAAAAAPQSPTSPAAEADKDGEAVAAGADAAVDPLQAAASKKDAASASKRVVYGRKLAPADLKR